MATVNYEELNQTRFAEDLQAVAKPPISDTELTQAYKHFGVKKGQVAGKTDAELYKKATQGILSWWKKAKGEGYYNQTEGAGKPVGASGTKPPKAPLPVFNQASMNQSRAAYGVKSPVPDWAKKNQDRFNTWLAMQLRRRGMTL